MTGRLENGASGVFSLIIEDDSRYLLYYRGNYPVEKGNGDSSEQQTVNVALSEDGIHFTRPELGIQDMGDNGKNNVIWQGIQGHNFIPFRDLNPSAGADKKFKAVGGVGENNLYALYSPDGFHWRLAQEEPLAITGAFDSANVALWDPVIGKYRLFSRFSEEGRGRAIQSCVSDDFIHWSDPIPHQYDAGAPVEQFYTNATVLVPGAEHILMSFPMRYIAERETPLEDTSAMDYPGTGAPGMAGMTDAVMMSSRDGVHWHRPFPEAWVRAGLDERNWTHRNTTPAVGILPLRDNEWSMYVSEHYGWPDNRLRRLSLRPWGFASVNAGWHGGEVITRPLTFSGLELRINFSTSAVGSVT
ncbi:MAG: glycoside hydrolase family protein, partial [Planctomycetota bacterium]